MNYNYNYRYVRLYQTLTVYSCKFLGLKAFIPLNPNINIPILLNAKVLVSYTGGKLLRNFEVNHKEKSGVIHLINFNNIENKTEITVLIQAVLNGVEQQGTTEGFIFLGM